MEFSLGDTGLVWLGNPEIWQSVSRVHSEDTESQAQGRVLELGCRIGVRGMEETVWVLVLGGMLCYHIRNFTTGIKQSGDGMDLGSRDSYWNFTSNVWLFLIYFLRQSHWCHIFPHNTVFCANWEMKIQHLLKQNSTIASGSFFQVVSGAHAARFDDGTVFILLEGDRRRCSANE